MILIGRLIDLTGKRFGRLLVLRRNGTAKDGTPLWECQCECGNIRDIRGTALRSDSTLSCGCLHSEIISKRVKKCNGKIYTRTDKSLDVVVNWRHEKEKELYGEFAYKYYKEVQ